MEVTAKLSNLRISARKVRLVVNVVRGLDVAEAEAQLLHSPKQASKPILTLLKSAVANAEHNFKLNKTDLFVKEIRADEGRTLYRFQPKAFGRATPLRKRSSHISLVLAPRKEATPVKEKEVVAEGKSKAEPKKGASKKATKPAAKKEAKTPVKKDAVKKPAAKKQAEKKTEKKETPKATKK